jgi:hypothetical protein
MTQIAQSRCKAASKEKRRIEYRRTNGALLRGIKACEPDYKVEFVVKGEKMAFKVYHFSVVEGMPSIINVPESGMNITGLIDYLAKEYGPEIKEKVIADGKLDPDITVSINGTHIRHLDGLNSEIPENSEVTVSFLIAGG